MAGIPVGSRACPVCRESLADDAVVCPNCGASLTAPIDSLMETLEDLEAVADRSLAEDLDELSKSAKVVKRRMPVAAEVIPRPRTEVPLVRRRSNEIADLTGLVRKVEAARGVSVEDMTREFPPNTNHLPAAAALLGVVVGAAGMLLISSSLLVGGTLLLAALALGFTGLAIRDTPPQ